MRVRDYWYCVAGTRAARAAGLPTSNVGLLAGLLVDFLVRRAHWRLGNTPRSPHPGHRPQSPLTCPHDARAPAPGSTRRGPLPLYPPSLTLCCLAPTDSRALASPRLGVSSPSNPPPLCTATPMLSPRLASTTHSMVPLAVFVFPAMVPGLWQNISTIVAVQVAHAPPSWWSNEVAL